MYSPGPAMTARPMIHIAPLTRAQGRGSPSNWLAAKIIGLIAYIVAGSFALRGPARTRPVAFAVAVAAFACIAGVALTKHPLGILTGVGV
jgi:uncharacterized membrane protein SirB2